VLKKTAYRWRQRRTHVAAVNQVSLSVEPRETVALVGESGSGKTTLSRLLLMLDRPDAGTVYFHDQDLRTLDRKGRARFRQDVQPVFQNPYASLNPRLRVRTIVAEPLIVSARVAGDPLNKQEVAKRVTWALEATGLRAADGERFPHEFSGGQRQRVAIARAIACKPKLIILDEPVSSQDISIQAQILNLLKDLQDELAISYLFIAHDLATVRFMSDRIAVMYQGNIVESGDSDSVFEQPAHPYTQALLAANLPDHPSERQRIAALKTAAATTPVNACAFLNRCPRAQPQCEQQTPRLKKIHGEHRAACFVATDEAEAANG